MSIPATIPAGAEGEAGDVSLLYKTSVLTGTYRITAPGAFVTTEAPEAAGTAADVLALLCFLLPNGPSVQGSCTEQLTETGEKSTCLSKVTTSLELYSLNLISLEKIQASFHVCRS